MFDFAQQVAIIWASAHAAGGEDPAKFGAAVAKVEAAVSTARSAEVAAFEKWSAAVTAAIGKQGKEPDAGIAAESTPKKPNPPDSLAAGLLHKQVEGMFAALQKAQVVVVTGAKPLPQPCEQPCWPALVTKLLEAGLSRQDVATACGVTPQAISSIRLDRQGNVSFTVGMALLRLAESAGVAVPVAGLDASSAPSPASAAVCA